MEEEERVAGEVVSGSTGGEGEAGGSPPGDSGEAVGERWGRRSVRNPRAAGEAGGGGPGRWQPRTA